MKRKITKTLATALAVATLATGASAKDWIESFDLGNAGIDTVPIVVGASQGGYTGPTELLHGFSVSLVGEAESGMRINGMTVGAGTGISVVESNIGYWDYPLSWQQIGGGDRRTLSLEVQFVLPLTSIVWMNHDPLAACEANMADKIDDGWTKEQVLAQEWNLSVQAVFSAEMSVVRRGNVQPALQTPLNRMDRQKDNHAYQIFVECQSVPIFENTVAARPESSADRRPDRTYAADRPSRDDNDRPRPPRLAIQAQPAEPRPSR